MILWILRSTKPSRTKLLSILHNCVEKGNSHQHRKSIGNVPDNKAAVRWTRTVNSGQIGAWRMKKWSELSSTTASEQPLHPPPTQKQHGHLFNQSDYRKIKIRKVISRVIPPNKAKGLCESFTWEFKHQTTQANTLVWHWHVTLYSLWFSTQRCQEKFTLNMQQSKVLHRKPNAEAGLTHAHCSPSWYSICCSKSHFKQEGSKNINYCHGNWGHLRTLCIYVSCIYIQDLLLVYKKAMSKLLTVQLYIQHAWIFRV